jgi:hypothetical protein
MTPIRKLLNRIHWDRIAVRPTSLIGYLDRIEKPHHPGEPSRNVFPEDTPDSFEVVDAEDRRHRVPFHRVKEVYWNGERIWRRTH